MAITNNTVTDVSYSVQSGATRAETLEALRAALGAAQPVTRGELEAALEATREKVKADILESMRRSGAFREWGGLNVHEAGTGNRPRRLLSLNRDFWRLARAHGTHDNETRPEIHC